mmetsp:Transcript_13083/g.20553  ORF Transcript_13083/g.20553 Transcript_13083/m.20553 type:complete len:212 (-) Transcript_13083:460-1095(-)
MLLLTSSNIDVITSPMTTLRGLMSPLVDSVSCTGSVRMILCTEAWLHHQSCFLDVFDILRTDTVTLFSCNIANTCAILRPRSGKLFTLRISSPTRSVVFELSETVRQPSDSFCNQNPHLFTNQPRNCVVFSFSRSCDTLGLFGDRKGLATFTVLTRSGCFASEPDPASWFGCLVFNRPVSSEPHGDASAVSAGSSCDCFESLSVGVCGRAR